MGGAAPPHLHPKPTKAMWTWDEEKKEWVDEADEDVGLLALVALVWDRIEQATLVATAIPLTGSWYQEMLDTITQEYVIQYLLGIGGVGQMTETDWKILRGLIDRQREFLENFDAERDRLSDAQIEARVKLYIRSSHQAFWYGRKRAKADAEEIRWVLDPLAENCPDCIVFDAMGWQRIEDDPYDGCVPSSGCTECLTNCRCILRFR